MASVAPPRRRLSRSLVQLQRRAVWMRLLFCLLAALLMWVGTRSWTPPFSSRSGYIPPRDIIARAAFTIRGEQGQRTYPTGQLLVTGGRPLSYADVQLLHAEHLAFDAERSTLQRLGYSLASFGIYLALFSLCGCYIYFHDRAILEEPGRLIRVLALVVVTVIGSTLAARDSWRAECIPLVLFGMTVAVVYRRELAFLLSLAVAGVVSLSLGQSLHEFIILTSTVAGPILMLNRIRSRNKLLYVGLAGAAVAFLTALGVGALAGQAYGISHTTHVSLDGGAATFLYGPPAGRLFAGASWYGISVILGAFLMTGLLPFVERVFDVQTDLRLLELGDAAHPLLQELARRAPGTYNHSINVASLAEAAAEAIGADGLLVRVGAYFHDIGKMLKSSYFVENQGQDANQHDSLLPAMSTLVIIAHVKDGADLGRRHRLPRSIIDFIEQHHGTTLVEYFYHRAEKRSAADPHGEKIDESSFRYPGPKPQSREAGVLMLADAAESACRAIVEPTPARIEGLVHDLLMKRLLDGQFDACSLTLQELNAIEDSLVKTLTAVYHGRIKYPDQQSA